MAAATPARSNRTFIYLAVAALLVAVIGAGGLLFFNKDADPPTGSPPTITEAAGIVVTPGGVLLPSVGATKQLGATRASEGATAQVTWTSSKPDVVSVDSAGLITAKALGSSQVIAAAGELTSAPVLVTVAGVAPGTVLVDDTQVIGDPVETNPGAAVTPDSTYDVVLSGVTVAVGDLLLGTGEKPVGGRVTATAPSGDDTKVTLARATLPELLPDLQLEEVIDLRRAPFEIPPALAADYDIVREGQTLRFTPKPAFVDRIAAAATANPLLASRIAAGPVANVGPLPYILPATTPIPPFDKCKEEDEEGEEEEVPAFLPFRLSEAPTFEVTVDPTLDVIWSGSEKHAIVRAAPVAKATIGLKVEAAFEKKFECKIQLGQFRVRAGWLALLLTGTIPVGIGFELGGEVTIAEFGIATELKASANVDIGVVCPGGTNCVVDGHATGSLEEPKFDVDEPSISDFRVKPSLHAFGYVEAKVGNPLVTSFGLEVGEAKFGPKLEAEWAPRVVQILDTEYSSKWALTLELEAKAGADLGELAEALGLEELTAVGFESSSDLAASPTGTLKTDRSTYAGNDEGTATITLNAANLSLLGAATVHHVLLVSYVAGQETILASVPATSAEQTVFDVPFTAPISLEANQLHAFVVTRVPGLGVDFFALELGSTTGGGRILFWRRDSNQRAHLYSVRPDGSDEREIPLDLGGALPVDTYGPTVSPDGAKMAIVGGFIGQGSGTYIVNSDGTGGRQLFAYEEGVGHVSWSADGSRLIFYAPSQTGGAIQSSTPEGGSVRTLISHTGVSPLSPTWSPDATRFAYVRRIEGEGIQIWVANTDGSGARQITQSIQDLHPQWSPDGSRILFMRLDATGNRIWSMNADGTDARPLSEGPGDFFPRWSPDGTQIVFQRATQMNTAAPGSVLVVMDADGSNEVELPIDGDPRMPGWAPSPAE